MVYTVSKPEKSLKGTVHLTASKSESNRVLIIRALCKDPFEINNLASAKDTEVLQDILASVNHQPSTINPVDVGAAGTTMRFLAAYFATLEGKRVLTGSERMKERPIKILVDALRSCGAKINYMEKEGYPPLEIEGTMLKGGEIEMDGSVSSQYISALLMMAPMLKDGLVIKFTGEITSRPYINMTIKIMERFGVHCKWDENSISVSKQQYQAKSDEVYEVEADWSAASYWYAMVAFSQEADLQVMGLKENSLQGDAVVARMFNFFGVHTEFIAGGIRLTKRKIQEEHFGFDFSDCPDLAQTLAVVTAGSNIPALFNGLYTLKIKETDRLQALKNELEKFGTTVKIRNDSSLEILPLALKASPTPVVTYHDHRMAMAFAPLALLLDNVKIEDPSVVEKSYPSFWDDLKSVGFVIS